MKAFPLAILIFYSTSAVAENNYLCITDLVTGFHHDFDQESWQHATFLAGERFTVNEFQENIFQAVRVDDINPWSAICTSRKDQTTDSFSCQSKTTEFHFNRKELRFTAFRYFGYWNGSRDSLSISIGTCFQT